MQVPVHMSIKNICARHNCSRSHLYRLLGAGLIEAKKNGFRILVDVASADAHFAQLPKAEIKPDKRFAAQSPSESAA
jgi:hypothetical protein